MRQEIEASALVGKTVINVEVEKNYWILTFNNGATLYVGDEPTAYGDSPLPDPPADLADAWARFQRGEGIEPWEGRALDEWRANCAEQDGY